MARPGNPQGVWSKSWTRLQSEREFRRQQRGKRHALRQLLGRARIRAKLFAHHHTEPALSIHYHAIHFFILSFCQVWQINANWLAALLYFCTDTVHSTSPLFQGARIPTKIVVNHK